MKLTLYCGCPRLKKSQGGRGKWVRTVVYLPGNQYDEAGLRLLVDKKVTARKVAAEGRDGGEDWDGGVGGGEGGHG